jgi:hypothetical protein
VTERDPSERTYLQSRDPGGLPDSVFSLRILQAERADAHQGPWCAMIAWVLERQPRLP